MLQALNDFETRLPVRSDGPFEYLNGKLEFESVDTWHPEWKKRSREKGDCRGRVAVARHRFFHPRASAEPVDVAGALEDMHMLLDLFHGDKINAPPPPKCQDPCVWTWTAELQESSPVQVELRIGTTGCAFPWSATASFMAGSTRWNVLSLRSSNKDQECA